MWAYIIYLVGKKHKKMCVQQTRLLLLDKAIKRCLVDMKNGTCSVGFILAEEETEDKLKALVSEKKLHLWKYYSTLLPVEIQLSLKDAEPSLEYDMEPKNWKKRLMTLAFQESEFCKSPVTEGTTSPIHEYKTSPNKVLNDELPVTIHDPSESKLIYKRTVTLLEKYDKRSTSSNRTKCYGVNPESKEGVFKSKQRSKMKAKKEESVKQHFEVRPKVGELKSSNTPQNNVQSRVYTPVLYSKVQKDVLQDNDANETMKVFKNSNIDRMSSIAPSLSSTENIIVSKNTEMPKEDIEINSSGVQYELFQLRNDFQQFKQQVITLLEKNDNTLQECYKDLKMLKQNKICTVQGTVENALPSKSLDDFLKFNNLLSKSPPHREELKKLYNVLIRGDTSVESCIRKMVKFTLSPAVQSEYSGEGKKFRGVTKSNYSETQTFQCLKEVLIQQFGFISELKTISARVGRWLSSNADREGVRNAKTRKLLNSPSNLWSL